VRKVYLLPNLVTTANLFCGFYSLISSAKAEYVHAAWAILAASIFDLLDGRIARMAKATSQFGIEYDSLSDLTSFGMAPAFLLYRWVLERYGRLGWAVAFLFLACGALRLARFNSVTTDKPSKDFQGMPIPIAAGLVATFTVFSFEVGWLFEPLVIISTALIALIMVSTIPFPSFKDLHWRSRATVHLLLAFVVSILFIAIRPEVHLFLVLISYTVGSLIWAGYKKWISKKSVETLHVSES
jgi:CDP-diacylglycerol--serine O-phosphatidyltransferase